MKKSKTVVEAMMAGVAAVALVGLVYAGGKSNTVDLKATNAHNITMTTSSSFCPTIIGDNQVTDTNLGLSANGYMWIGLSGTGDGKAGTWAEKGWIVYDSVFDTSTTLTGSAQVDIYANNITAASFAGDTNLKVAEHDLQMKISLYTNGYSENAKNETPLVTQTGSTADFTDIHTTINRVRYTASDTESATTGFMVYISSVSISFSC